MDQTQTRARANAARTGKPLIESDRVEGTTVLDIRGEDIGSIKRLMIDKLSGRVAYAVMSFGGFLGIGAEEHAIPWGKLKYDTSLSGYRTDITVDELQRAPTSHAIRNTTGAIASGSRSCTITTGSRITGGADPAVRSEFCSCWCATAALLVP